MPPRPPPERRTRARARPLWEDPGRRAAPLPLAPAARSSGLTTGAGHVDRGDLDGRDAPLLHAELLGGAGADVDDPVARARAVVLDHDRLRPAVLEVGDRARVPSGSARFAAERERGSKHRPLAMRRPWNSRP